MRACCLLQDVSFWLPEQGFTENNLCELVRGIAGDMVESVSIIDSFTHPKKQRTSHCYRRALRVTAPGHHHHKSWCLLSKLQLFGLMSLQSVPFR